MVIVSRFYRVVLKDEGMKEKGARLLEKDK
jgi:hypothetical protein